MLSGYDRQLTNSPSLSHVFWQALIAADLFQVGLPTNDDWHSLLILTDVHQVGLSSTEWYMDTNCVDRICIYIVLIQCVAVIYRCNVRHISVEFVAMLYQYNMWISCIDIRFGKAVSIQCVAKLYQYNVWQCCIDTMCWYAVSIQCVAML